MPEDYLQFITNIGSVDIQWMMEQYKITRNTSFSYKKLAFFRKICTAIINTI